MAIIFFMCYHTQIMILGEKVDFFKFKVGGIAPEGGPRKKYKKAYNLVPMHFWVKIKALS